MTPPVETCKNSANTLVVKGVAIPSSYFCKAIEKNKDIKTECNIEENIKIPHNVQCLNDKELEKKISEQPVLNMLRKLASLFELVVISDNNMHLKANADKKKADKKDYKIQIEPNEKTESKNYNYKTDKEICPYMTQAEPYVLRKSDYGDHSDVIPIGDYNTKTELV